MKFTGERMIPEHNINEEIYLEHISRYFFASQFVKDKVVLDIACGSGYGSDLLLKYGAKKIWGVDISVESIEYCKKKYKSDELNFLVGDIENIPISNSDVDVIVSMETIEHVDEKAQIKFLSESKRVLKPEGIFVVSTPNSLILNGNPFHKKELKPDEFYSVLKKSFEHVKLFYQDNIESSLIMSGKSLRGEMLHDNPKLKARKINNMIPEESMYLIAVCGDVDLGQKDDEYIVIFNNRIRNFYRQMAQKEQIIKEKNEEIRKKADSCKFEIQEATIQLINKIKEKEEELTNWKDEIKIMQSSKFWKMRNKYMSLKNGLKIK